MAADVRFELRGRRDECDVLDRVLDDARAGNSRVLVLRGEAGIGKSALLDYLRDRAADCRVARTVGVESETAFAFGGLHGLCGPMLADLNQLPAPQRDALRTTFGLTAGPPPDPLLLGLAVLGLLTAAADGAPLVCLVDDAQWLDPATALTLAFVARRLDADAVALVFAIREPAEESLFAGLPELRIGGLADDHARALLDSVVTGALDQRVRDRVITETRGNPLALLELTRGLTPAELELGIGAHDATTMASRIEQGFLRQVEHVSVDTRRLLLAAAVEPLGDVPLLLRAAEHLGVDLEAAAPAEDAGLIAFGGRVTFRHPLVRSALCRTAGISELREVHSALAAATDPEVEPDRRAWHRAHAAAAPDEDIAGELQQAAQRARSRGALVTAAELMSRATELTPEPAQRGARALIAVATKIFAAQYESGLESLSVAELGPLDEVQQAWVIWLRASILSALKRESATQMFREAAERFHDLDGPTAREAYLNAVGTQMMAGRLEGVDRLHDVAVTARSAPPGPEPRRPIDATLDAFAIRFSDGYAAAVTAATDALQACTQEPVHSQQFLQWLWFAPLMAPEYWHDDLWDRITAHVVKLNRDAGAYSTLPIALEYRAEFELHTGRFESARALLAEADTIVELVRRSPLTHTSLELAAWGGDEDHARSVIDAGVEVMVAGHTGRTVGLGEHAKAVLYNGLGRYDDALLAAQQACAFDDLGVYGRSLVEGIEAAVRTGAVDDARDDLRLLEVRTLAAGTDWALGVLARSRALVAGTGDPEPSYLEAIERLQRTRMVTHLARAHLVYGEWLRRQGRRVDARVQLRQAVDMLDGMGADGFAERARRELQATGETVRKRSSGADQSLTPQELQIARLAAAGRTNPEIGSELFVSPRTVEYHLSKVFSKLGVTSRRDLRRVIRVDEP